MDRWSEVGRFSESGRGVPLALSRPGGALPYSPLTRQAIAMHPMARLGWAGGVLCVAEVPLEPAHALQPWSSLAAAAAYMMREESDFAPVCDDEEQFLGIVPVEAVLQCVADDRKVPNVEPLMSTQIPTCAPKCALVDAVRTMLACHLRKIPVVGDAGALEGLLTLSEAVAASVADPEVAEVLERAAASPSLFAWRMR